MFVLDTSVLVAAFTHERDTAKVQTWMALNDVDCFISAWNLTEFASALAIKVRQGHLTMGDGLRAQTSFNVYVNTIAFVLPIERRHMEVAADLCANPALIIRAADALHLAVALEVGAGLATLDAQLGRATQALGLTTAEI